MPTSPKRTSSRCDATPDMSFLLDYFRRPPPEPMQDPRFVQVVQFEKYRSLLAEPSYTRHDQYHADRAIECLALCDKLERNWMRLPRGDSAEDNARWRDKTNELAVAMFAVLDHVQVCALDIWA